MAAQHRRRREHASSRGSHRRLTHTATATKINNNLKGELEKITPNDAARMADILMRHTCYIGHPSGPTDSHHRDGNADRSEIAYSSGRAATDRLR